MHSRICVTVEENEFVIYSVNCSNFSQLFTQPLQLGFKKKGGMDGVSEAREQEEQWIECKQRCDH